MARNRSLRVASQPAGAPRWTGPPWLPPLTTSRSPPAPRRARELKGSFRRASGGGSARQPSASTNRARAGPPPRTARPSTCACCGHAPPRPPRTHRRPSSRHMVDPPTTWTPPGGSGQHPRIPDAAKRLNLCSWLGHADHRWRPRHARRQSGAGAVLDEAVLERMPVALSPRAMTGARSHSVDLTQTSPTPPASAEAGPHPPARSSRAPAATRSLLSPLNHRAPRSPSSHSRSPSTRNQDPSRGRTVVAFYSVLAQPPRASLPFDA